MSPHAGRGQSAAAQAGDAELKLRDIRIRVALRSCDKPLMVGHFPTVQICGIRLC